MNRKQKTQKCNITESVKLILISNHRSTCPENHSAMMETEIDLLMTVTLGNKREMDYVLNLSICKLS